MKCDISSVAESTGVNLYLEKMNVKISNLLKKKAPPWP
jgi:hypothetical protein